MTDREKVISTLEEIKTQTAGIGLDSAVIAHKFIDKIIALMKEQEATIEILVKDITFHNCNNCNRKDCESKPNAGQPVRSNCIYWLGSR